MHVSNWSKRASACFRFQCVMPRGLTRCARPKAAWDAAGQACAGVTARQQQCADMHRAHSVKLIGYSNRMTTPVLQKLLHLDLLQPGHTLPFVRHVKQADVPNHSLTHLSRQHTLLPVLHPLVVIALSRGSCRCCHGTAGGVCALLARATAVAAAE